jgi:hypothetical protein
MVALQEKYYFIIHADVIANYYLLYFDYLIDPRFQLHQEKLFLQFN